MDPLKIKEGELVRLKLLRKRKYKERRGLNQFIRKLQTMIKNLENEIELERKRRESISNSSSESS